MAIQLKEVSVDKGESLIIKIDGSVEKSLSIVVDTNGNCFVKGPFNFNSVEWFYSNKGWAAFDRDTLKRPSHIRLPGMVRAYYRPKGITEADVTNDMCRPNDKGTGRYCIDCKQAIEVEGMQKDELYYRYYAHTLLQGFYRHAECPVLFDYPPSPSPTSTPTPRTHVPPFGRTCIE